MDTFYPYQPRFNRPRPRFQTNYFVPNLRPNGPRNLLIKPYRSNFRPRLNYRPPNQRFNNNYKIGRRKSKKNNIQRNLTAPVRIGNNVNTTFVMNGKTCRFIQPLTDSYFRTNHCVIPSNPLFYGGRMGNFTKMFSTYKLKTFAVRTSPLLGTDQGGSIVIGYNRNCTPIATTNTTIFSEITNLQSVNGPVWSPLRHEIKGIDKNFIYSVVPINMKDVPYTFYITHNNSAITLLDTIIVYVELEFEGVDLATGQEIDEVNTTVATVGTVNYNVNGFNCTVLHGQPSVCINVGSTLQNTHCDIGELVTLPSFPIAGTNYLFNATHNTQGFVATDYADYFVIMANIN